MAQIDEDRRILAEIKPGIDLGDSDLVTHPDEHWLIDENNILRLTHYDGTISNNYWNPISGILRLNDSGTTSENWTLDGANILRINT